MLTLSPMQKVMSQSNQWARWKRKLSQQSQLDSTKNKRGTLQSSAWLKVPRISLTRQARPWKITSRMWEGTMQQNKTLCVPWLATHCFATFYKLKIDIMVIFYLIRRVTWSMSISVLCFRTVQARIWISSRWPSSSLRSTSIFSEDSAANSSTNSRLSWSKDSSHSGSMQKKLFPL